MMVFLGEGFMTDKTLSISIASYNVEKYLEKTIASLTEDKDILNKLEIIIVNDGSKDGTLQLANKLQAEYPGTIIVIDKINGGYGSTINSSLDVASGKYYRLLDGDDWYDSKSLGAYIEYLDNCESDMVITPYYEVRQNAVVADLHPEIPKESGSLVELTLENNFFAMHEIAIKTDLLKSYDRKIAEHCFYTDAEFVFYCISAANTISRFDKAVYCYRLGLEGQSVSITGLRKHYKDLPVVAKRIYEAYTNNSKTYSGKKKDILQQSLRTITYNTYLAYMLLEKPEKEKRELVLFDKFIKHNYKEVYKLTGDSKMIKICRLTHFKLYKYICRMEMQKFNKENR